MTNIELQDGAVLKNGREIARLDATRHVVLSPKALGPRVYKAVEAAIQHTLGWKPVFDIGEPNEVPPAPEMTAAAGDKTPSFVEWMKKYHPREAAQRYAGRGVEGIV
jgi:hypothetical protein